MNLRRSKSCSSFPQTNTMGEFSPLFSPNLQRPRSHHSRVAEPDQLFAAIVAASSEKDRTKLVASANAEAMTAEEAAREAEFIAKREEREQAVVIMEEVKRRAAKLLAAGLEEAELNGNFAAFMGMVSEMSGCFPQSGASVYADQASSSGARPLTLSPLPVRVTDAERYREASFRAVPRAPRQRPIIAGSFNDFIFQSLPTYGPVFCPREYVFFHRLKEEIFCRVSGNAPASTDFIEQIMLDIGVEALGEVSNAYANGTSLGADEIFNILIRDACFFNALLLYYFGADLGYPPDHAVFGSNRDTNKLREWLDSMFVPGNQIPTLVLRKVMSQHFFRRVIEQTREWKKPVGVQEMVLFDSLLQPAISNDQGAVWGDLLQALHSKMIGPGADRNQGHVVLDMPDASNAVEESAIKFGSASELKHLGVHFKVADGNAGCRGIDFKKKHKVRRVLSLPLLEVDSSTEFLFRCLIAYEGAQHMRKREVSSYCSLLGDLVPSFKDARILASKGIIEGEIADLPRILSCLPRITGDSNRFTPEHHTVRLNIDDYTRSIKKLKKYAYFGLKLTAAVGCSFFMPDFSELF